VKVSTGYEDESALTVDGGSLTTVEDLALGWNGGSGTLNMISGVINVGRDFEVGRGAQGTVNMIGGTITVGDDFMIPEAGTTNTAHVNLDGGVIIVSDDLTMGEVGGSMDITAGTLIIDANVVPVVQRYIDNGWITAYDGDGTIQLDYDVTNEGQTTVTAVHKLVPNPVNGSIAPAGQVELSWTLPDPLTPGEPVSVDVYITDNLNKLVQFTDPASMQVVSNRSVTSVAVQTVPKTQYYWAVDTYIGDPNDPIFGPIFSFLAGNVPPVVDAGDDVLTWLDNGSVEVGLSATVEDSDPTTLLWTVVSQPNDPTSPQAFIADPTALNTTITLSALGEYVLKLEAHDGENPGQPDTLTINIFSDHCEAAKSSSDWTALPGDINLDCVVNQADMDLLLEQWLNCNGLDCPEPVAP